MGKRGKLPKQSLPVATAPVERTESKAYEARERRYRAENALSDIERAEKHKMDKNLMKDVKQVCKEKMQTLGKIK